VICAGREHDRESEKDRPKREWLGESKDDRRFPKNGEKK